MSVITIELAASKLQSELLNEDKIETIHKSLFESGDLDESIFESEELIGYKELMELFINDIYNYIEKNLYKFIGEDAQETYTNISVFAGEAMKAFLSELAEADFIVKNLDEVDSDFVNNLIVEAATSALSHAQGAVDLLQEISPRAKKALGAAGALAALGGLAYAGYKNKEDIGEFLKKIGSRLSKEGLNKAKENIEKDVSGQGSDELIRRFLDVNKSKGDIKTGLEGLFTNTNPVGTNFLP